MLEVDSLEVSYGQSPALRGVSLSVEAGELVAVIGANGAGKTTLLRSISGLIKPRKGSVRFRGKRIDGTPAQSIVKLGLVQVPEGRGTLPDMTVLENLEMGAYLCRDRRIFADRLQQVLTLFPILAERRSQLAGTLSGGEQQMLAVGRGLMAGPRLLLLDEPSLGLAPMMVQRVAETISALHKEQSLSILLVEQNARMALTIADRAYVLQTGEVVMEEQATNLLNNAFIQQAYLGV